jgi:UDP-glucose 4-epimerase
MGLRVMMSGASGYAGGAISVTLQSAGIRLITAGRRHGDNLALDLMHSEQLAYQTLPQGIDVLIHAAAVHEVLCRQDPVAAYTANVTATRALLESARKAGVKRFIYVSTFHVFGSPEGRIDESRSPQPNNDYGLTHMLAEQIFMMLANQYQYEVSILRPANLFGTPIHWPYFNRWTLAPFDFVQQALNNGRIVLRSDGAQIRNYVSLSHWSNTVLAAVRGELPELTHVAGQCWSMKALAILAAEVVEDIIKRPVSVVLGEARSVEARYHFCSNTWTAELDERNEKMRFFLAQVALYITRK